MQIVVVGRSIMGIFLARMLDERRVPWSGIHEAESHTGFGLSARLPFFSPETARILRRFEPAVRLEHFHTPQEQLGRFLNLKDPREYAPCNVTFVSENPLINPIDPISSHFSIACSIRRLERRKLTFTDDNELPFDCLLWCASARRLRDLAVTNSSPLLRIPKIKEDSGSVEIIRGPLVSYMNEPIHHFEFRFKGSRVLVMQIYRPQCETNHILESSYAAIPFSIHHDPEEQAKFIRTMKREIRTQESTHHESTKERIVYHENNLSIQPELIKSTAVSENIYFCGSDLALSSVSPLARSIEIGLHNAENSLVSLGIWS